jgi:hypothetical protein
VTTASAHEFFAACASVAGALIGLLFVAISVAPERILGPEASDVHGVRAAATLTAFTNALIVVLFGLIPGFNAGNAAFVIAIIGLLFIGGAWCACSLDGEPGKSTSSTSRSWSGCWWCS